MSLNPHPPPSQVNPCTGNSLEHSISMGETFEFSKVEHLIFLNGTFFCEMEQLIS
jgi:hypothetical protein